MSDLEILESGEVVVPDELKGTFADHRLPLFKRVGLLAETKEVPPCLLGESILLLREAADHLSAVRDVASRRARAQQAVQTQLHRAQQEVTFLRKYILQEIGKDPEFFQQMPVG